MSVLSPSLSDHSLRDAVSPDYWFEARRPFAALLFLLPLLAIYEVGILSLGADALALRNGADCWMRSWLMGMGITHHWILPILVVAVLAGWHHTSGDRWRCSFDTLKGMFGESLLFAVLLVVIGQLLNLGFRHYGLATVSIDSPTAPPTNLVAARTVSFIGAGVYEEVLFRLAAIPACFYLLRAALIPRTIAITVAVIGTSLLFAVAHYLGTNADGLTPQHLVSAAWQIADDPGCWYSFTFRVIAGLSFSLLFVLRGFGITVGCHALYDLLVGILMHSTLS